MKLPGLKGDYAFKALLKNGNGWKLTKEYFFTQTEVMHFNEGYETIWPVEVQDGQIVYVPEQEELS